MANFTKKPIMSLAKNKLKSSITELEQLLSDAGAGELANQAGQKLRSIREQLDKQQLKAVLVIYSDNTYDPNSIMQNWLPMATLKGEEWVLETADCSILIQIRDWRDPYLADEGIPFSIGIAAMLPGSSAILDVYQHVVSTMLAVPHLVVIAAPEDKSGIENGITNLIHQTIDYTFVPLDSQRPQLLQDVLQKKTADERVDWLEGYTGIVCLEDLRQTLLLMLDQEEKNIKAKRQVNQQQLTRLKISTNNTAIDWLSQLKSSLQNQFNLFEKGVNNRLDQAFRGQSASYLQMIEASIQQLDTLEEEELAKTTIIKIPPKFENQFLTELNNYLLNFGIEDLRTLKDTLELTGRELESFFNARNIPYHPPTIRYATTERLEEVIKQLLALERPFKGEKPRKGMYEYFMAVRKYQMILMMLFSTFGLSFVQRIRTFMIPVTVLLIGYGIFNVVKTVQRERVEEKDKQLDRSKDSLRQEAKRIASEFARSWSRFMAEFLKDQNDTLLAQLEFQVKSIQQKGQQEDEELRNKLQRIQMGLESQERRMENFRRNLSNWERNLNRTLSELKAGYLQVARKDKS